MATAEPTSSPRLPRVPRPRRSEARAALERGARFGLVVQGVVFGLVGVLAGMTAIGAGGGIEDPEGVLSLIAFQPLGRVLVATIAAGMLAYAVWRIVQSVADLDQTGSGWRGLVVRTFGGLAATVYLGFAWAALRLAVLGSRLRGGEVQREWTRQALGLGWPLGAVLVAGFGLGIVVAAFYQLVQAYTLAEYAHVDRSELGDGEWRRLRLVSRFGIAARAVVFAMVGGFFVQAGVKSDPYEVAGLEVALEVLGSQPYGAILLGAAALGLVAFCAHALIMARHRFVVGRPRSPAG